ncbi:MAG: DUF2752 domain-containing protein [Bacilli bacterium]
MTNNYKFILFIFGILLVFGILVVFVFDINCLFKTIFNIPCPGCGLTRGFRALFKGNLIEAFNYNILTIPIFLFLIISAFLIIFDIIKKTNFLEKYLSLFTKHYFIIIFLITISFIVNIIKGV